MRETIKKRVNFFLIGFVIVFIVAYSLYESKNLLVGPELKIYSPAQKYISTNSDLLEIKGNAKNILGLSINDRPILITPEGDFSDKLLLLPGYNRIAVSAKDKFGQEETKIIEAVLIN